MQLLLIGRFDAQLADQRRAGVGLPVDLLEIALADGGDVTERVNREIVVRVPARLARLDIDTAELEAVHGEARDVFFGHAQAQRHAVERPARADGALHVVEIVARQEPEVHETLERRAHVLHLLGDELELIGGLVARDDFAVAVEDESARSRDRLDAHAIAL